MYNNVARNMMARMGWEKGKGLGKEKQGRVSIVEASMQRGRRGLGNRIDGLEPSNSVMWQDEEITTDERVEWLPSCTEAFPTQEALVEWIKEGEKKVVIDDETEFCTKDVLEDVIQSKTVFDNLENDELRRARTRANPFETIRGGFFQNRAAMKMANIDAVFDYMFTNPKDEHGMSLVKPSELVYFADICAGPGGFSEYILWRLKSNAKGFGFTLRGNNDFKLDEFYAAPCEFFEPHYGVGGLEGDGDVTKLENLEAFRDFVMQSTQGAGLHFVMADGGFSVEGQENLQEVLSKQLYLCQFCCALSVLRIGGNFVCKLFDIFTPFSVGLVYLLYRSFRRVCIHKPITSRPANSERYIVCEGMREGAELIHDYLYEVNRQLCSKYGVLAKRTITEVVPLDVMKGDKAFFDYILQSNIRLGENQALHLNKIKAFAQNVSLHEVRQSEVRRQCFEAWDIPDQVRAAPSKPEPGAKFEVLMKHENQKQLKLDRVQLDAAVLASIDSIYNYKCIVSGGECTFLMGFGRSHVYRRLPNGKWMKLDINVELPRETLVLAELVNELRGEDDGPRPARSCLGDPISLASY
ncbi:PREDICTED: cap-specific mRNA (nucleoside-2'-O-)-methyltransferase 1-like [Priapulus caudatus]|uniref:Cap-specific mRNA (nucleoside-2'-O-)-methyltransferase 1 n=1 Tax=Priapulus caudatus TaxID=37621 RepID=A0ABM1DZB2_PRICU|nr:PREDICTED: cap-specific mRNA (nucleoside-2'-O-)-methyltransferase 1-like [Priapulus caudatus]